jgi:hypothetical protein
VKTIRKNTIEKTLPGKSGHTVKNYCGIDAKITDYFRCRIRNPAPNMAITPDRLFSGEGRGEVPVGCCPGDSGEVVFEAVAWLTDPVVTGEPAALFRSCTAISRFFWRFG